MAPLAGIGIIPYRFPVAVGAFYHLYLLFFHFSFDFCFRKSDFKFLQVFKDVRIRIAMKIAVKVEIRR